MHPLSPDLSGFNDDELQKKHNELNSRMNAAYRSGNSDLVMQIQMLISDYHDEISSRQRKMMDELHRKSGKDFDDIIDIK